MTDRDHFAAAALTGLIAVMRDESIGEICESAYGWADAMLRERGSQSEPPNSSPVTEPMRKERQAEVSAGSEPVAWAVVYPNDEVAVIAFKRQDAEERATASDRIVPLYRQPPCQDFLQKNLTLTDAEREAVATAIGVMDWQAAYFSRLNKGEPLPSATLRGLLERTK